MVGFVTIGFTGFVGGGVTATGGVLPVPGFVITDGGTTVCGDTGAGGGVATSGTVSTTATGGGSGRVYTVPKYTPAPARRIKNVVAA